MTHGEEWYYFFGVYFRIKIIRACNSSVLSASGETMPLKKNPLHSVQFHFPSKPGKVFYSTLDSAHGVCAETNDGQYDY